MLAYGGVVIDIDLGIGRQYGYRDPANAQAVEDMRDPPQLAAECHPDRRRYAKGKCRSCYQHDWKASR